MGMVILLQLQWWLCSHEWGGHACGEPLDTRGRSWLSSLASRSAWPGCHHVKKKKAWLSLCYRYCTWSPETSDLLGHSGRAEGGPSLLLPKLSSLSRSCHCWYVLLVSPTSQKPGRPFQVRCLWVLTHSLILVKCIFFVSLVSNISKPGVAFLGGQVYSTR